VCLVGHQHGLMTLRCNLMTSRRRFLATLAGAALGSSRLIASRHGAVTDVMALVIGQAAYTMTAELSAAIEEGLKETA
jgi:hypothetical protein